VVPLAFALVPVELVDTNLNTISALSNRFADKILRVCMQKSILFLFIQNPPVPDLSLYGTGYGTGCAAQLLVGPNFVVPELQN
jgi:hypothetical protein